VTYSRFVTATEANLYPGIKAYERREYDRFIAYLERLDAGGWVEQSYCTDWLVYQVVSHIGSGSRIRAMRVNAWVNGGPPVSREVMQGVWGLFDSLTPGQMFNALSEAASEYVPGAISQIKSGNRHRAGPGGPNQRAPSDREPLATPLTCGTNYLATQTIMGSILPCCASYHATQGSVMPPWLGLRCCRAAGLAAIVD
jgi:hypothetical protein